MNVWLEGWSGSLVLIYVVPKQEGAKGDIFPSKAICMRILQSLPATVDTGNKNDEEENAPAVPVPADAEGPGAKYVNAFQNFVWKKKQAGLNHLFPDPEFFRTQSQLENGQPSDLVIQPPSVLLKPTRDRK